MKLNQCQYLIPLMPLKTYYLVLNLERVNVNEIFETSLLFLVFFLFKQNYCKVYGNTKKNYI